MTRTLSSFPNTASCRAMFARLSSLFLVFAILFCSVVEPAMVNAEDIIPTHVSGNFDAVEKAVSNKDHGTSDLDGEAPCHVVSHHHCNMALATDATSVKFGSKMCEADETSLLASSMSSFSQAPPVEPPAA